MKRFIFLFLIILSLLFVSSCNKECSKALDCEQKKCFTSSCIKGMCDYSAADNCCGNDVQEKIEDGKTGNSCTCSADYGPCTGSKGDFMEKHCQSNKCVYYVPREKVKDRVYSEDKDLGLFKIELMTKYDKPFVIGDSNFTVIITLKDTDSRLITPVTFTQFRLFQRDRLLGKGVANLKFSRIGDSYGVVVPFDFSMENSEEEVSVTLKIDYEYKMTTSTGIQLYREDFTQTYGEKFNFINPSMEN